MNSINNIKNENYDSLDEKSLNELEYENERLNNEIITYINTNKNLEETNIKYQFKINNLVNQISDINDELDEFSNLIEKNNKKELKLQLELDQFKLLAEEEFNSLKEEFEVYKKNSEDKISKITSEFNEYKITNEKNINNINDEIKNILTKKNYWFF